MVDGKHFTPAATDLIDGVTILPGCTAYEPVEARQKHLLQLREELIYVVFRLERLHSTLIHMLHTTSLQMQDLNLDFQINPHSDPDICRITSL